MSNSHVKVENCTFKNNLAKNGGAIAIDCNYLIPCQNEIINSEFRNNTAVEDGGAIIYNSYPPTISNNTYFNNTGVYGSNIASYAVRIMQVVDGQFTEFTQLSHVSYPYFIHLS